MDKKVKQRYEEKLLKSLKEDGYKWKREYCGAAGYDWVEYHSPEYGRVSFMYGLGHSVGVYIDGYKRFSISPRIFSKLWWAVRYMKEEVDDVIKGKSNKFLESVLDDEDLI